MGKSYDEVADDIFEMFDVWEFDDYESFYDAVQSEYGEVVEYIQESIESYWVETKGEDV